MTLSLWLHWHWLSILSVEVPMSAAASLSWLCRCIWWLNVSWSYATQWRHLLRHLTTLKSLTEDISLIELLIIWLLSWMLAVYWEWDIYIILWVLNNFAICCSLFEHFLIKSETFLTAVCRHFIVFVDADFSRSNVICWLSWLPHADRPTGVSTSFSQMSTDLDEIL